MTDQEINIAIAEACGWTLDDDTVTKPDGSRYARHDGLREIPLSDIIPNYAHDLNAMHEAEKTLESGRVHEEYYYTTLAEMLCADELAETWAHYRVLIHVAARQRAEAFLKTVGKWTDDF